MFKSGFHYQHFKTTPLEQHKQVQKHLSKLYKRLKSPLSLDPQTVKFNNYLKVKFWSHIYGNAAQSHLPTRCGSYIVIHLKSAPK